MLIILPLVASHEEDPVTREDHVKNSLGGTYTRPYWVGLLYVCLATSGIPILHQILEILAESIIPHRGKAAHITVYCL